MDDNTSVRKQMEEYRITPMLAKVIAFGPIIGLVVSFVLLSQQTTQRYALWMLKENHPVELLTFAFLFLGGALGLRLAWQAAARRESGFFVAFYYAFSFGMFWTAMEEISWGQWFFGFRTPDDWKAINTQGETNIHNLEVLGGRSEPFRLAFGLGGVLGLSLSRISLFRKIGVPLVLAPALITILLHASVDVYCSFVQVNPQFVFLLDRTSEVTELLIGMVGALYVWINSRMLKDDWSRSNV